MLRRDVVDVLGAEDRPGSGDVIRREVIAPPATHIYNITHCLFQYLFIIHADSVGRRG